MKKRSSPSPLLRGGLMLLAAAAIAVLWPRLEPMAAGLLQKAALFTTVLDMPAGALETLRERYADQLLPEEPQPVPQPVDEVPELRSRLLIAGGVAEDNVAEIESIFHPFGVDVSGSLEVEGEKSIEKIESFMKAVKALNAGHREGAAS